MPLPKRQGQSRGGRGLGSYGMPVKTDAGELVSVQDSSNVKLRCWLKVVAEGHVEVATPRGPLPVRWHSTLDGPDRLAVIPVDVMVQLSPQQAKRVRDRLTAWLVAHGEEDA
jgi:hypothetical protein